ncbi:MAG: 6-phosphogluconolactonase [Omnitrophica WOR_2 bacterium RIFCSPLOWO2_12_FULL_50_9]|nr:MAG: 6-phosphogluconolactonase [Omnitrophica WOR_2 bacterium RIFCSPHIGHO2_02_FULL_50_17]OGX40362.1 MAG: 6-phosphogluconolactonase [Omnitrophica WOR_2 bacterium RIFCSPLOWO2_12_FULL_50_9]
MRPLKREVLVFEDTRLLIRDLLKRWVALARAAIDENGLFNAALCGGCTPVEFYRQLSRLQNSSLWQKTHLFLTDERFVPPDDEESNFGMIQDSLLSRVDIPSANIHPMVKDPGDVCRACGEYAEVLQKHFVYPKNRFPCFDLILLGLGEDGHTASLFPQMPYHQDSPDTVVPVSLPRLKHKRISLTLSVINNSRHVLFLIMGAKKSRIVKDIIEGKKACPAACVNPIHGQLTYYLDKEAAQRLSPRKS